MEQYVGGMVRLERGPQVRLYLVNVCPPLTFSELSKTVNVCSANYVTPSNCFTKQVGECAFTRRYIYAHIHTYMAHEPTTKDRARYRSPSPLFDYLTDATIKSSPIGHHRGFTCLLLACRRGVPLGNHVHSFVFLHVHALSPLPYDFSLVIPRHTRLFDPSYLIYANFKRPTSSTSVWKMSVT